MKSYPIGIATIIVFGVALVYQGVVLPMAGMILAFTGVGLRYTEHKEKISNFDFAVCIMISLVYLAILLSVLHESVMLDRLLK